MQGKPILSSMEPFATYEYELRVKRNDDQTWRNWSGVRDRFLGWCGDHGVTPIDATRRDMLRYFGSLSTLEPSTVHRHWVNLHAAYRRAVHPYKMIEEDPTSDLPLPPIRLKPTTTLTEYDLRAIRDSCQGPELLAWHLFVYTGMRAVEARRLKWEDVNLTFGIIKVTGKRTERGDDHRIVPIHPKLRLALLSKGYHLGGYVLDHGRPRGSMLGTTAITQAIKRPAKVAGVQLPTGSVCHIIRRTVASSLRRNGVDGDTIDTLLGWAPSSMRARRYMDYREDDLRTAVLRLYADDPL